MCVCKDLAIIIVNYKNYQCTINCVNRLILFCHDYKIVIVDNHSENMSYEHIKEEFTNSKNIFVIESDANRGYASGNNIGIKFILNEFNSLKYICIMNPDVIIDYANLFSNLILKIENRDEISGITAISLTNNKLDYKAIGWKLPKVLNLMNINLVILAKLFNTVSYKSFSLDNHDRSLGSIDVMPGSFFIIKKLPFEEISFFDEKTFLYYEENILASKIKKLNKKFVVSINDYYIHNHLVKDIDFMNYKYASNDYRNTIKSQKYYVLNYLNKSYLIWLFVAITGYIHLYLEIPIIIIIKTIFKNAKKIL
ncbi:MAG: glycosyltransferase [Clostridia bacterium]